MCTIAVDTRSTSPEGAGEEHAAGIVLFREGVGTRDYLILRHRDGGHWGFPKGHIEHDEDALSAAQREIREETGIRKLHLIPGFSSTSRYRVHRDHRLVDKSVIYYLAQVDERATLRLSAEHSDGRWLCAERAARTLTYEESREILAEAERFLTGHGA